MHPLILFPRHRILTPAECLGGYPTPRGADGIGCGMGLGLAFGGRRAFTPASLPNLAAWYEAVDEPATLVRATQPTPDDWDMEAAGTTAYSALDSTLAKVAGSPSGSGSQVLRVTSTGDTFWATQAGKLIDGNRYDMGVWLRSDGSSVPRLFDGVNIINGPSSGAWGLASDEITAAGVIFLGSADAHPGWVEVDNLTATNLSRTRWNPRAGSLGGYLSQATAAAQFWASSSLIGTHAAVEFDGTADYNASSLAASAWPLHKAAGATVVFTFQPAAGGAGTGTIYDTCDGDNTNVGICIDYDTAGETLNLKVTQDGTGTWAINDSIACSKGDDHYVEIYWSSAGYSIRVDGGAATTGSVTGTLSTNDATATLQQGRKSGGSDFFEGLLGDTTIQLVADATGAANAGAYLKTEYGL